jgi:hypothetical protein
MNAPNQNMDKAALALHGSLDGGAKPKLTKSMAKQIARELASSAKPLTQLCALHPEWPTYDELKFQQDRHQWFRNIIQAARVAQADYLAQDCMALEQEMLKREEPAMPWVQARKVVMENRRWYTSKVYRAVYGDDPSVNVATQVNVSIPAEKLASIRERLEAARSLVPPREQGDASTSGSVPETDTLA